MSYEISKVVVIAVSVLLIVTMGLIMFFPFVIADAGEVAKGTITSAQEVMSTGVSRILSK